MGESGVLPSQHHRLYLPPFYLPGDPNGIATDAEHSPNSDGVFLDLVVHGEGEAF